MILPLLLDYLAISAKHYLIIVHISPADYKQTLICQKIAPSGAKIDMLYNR